MFVTCQLHLQLHHRSFAVTVSSVMLRRVAQSGDLVTWNVAHADLLMKLQTGSGPKFYLSTHRCHALPRVIAAVVSVRLPHATSKLPISFRKQICPARWSLILAERSGRCAVCVVGRHRRWSVLAWRQYDPCYDVNSVSFQSLLFTIRSTPRPTSIAHLSISVAINVASLLKTYFSILPQPSRNLHCSLFASLEILIGFFLLGWLN